jgi:hypothetical protein
MELMRALQHWGSKWADLTPEQAHPGVVLWMWATFFLERDRLPQRRVLLRFDYPTLSGPGSRSWLLIERSDAEICERYPGGEEHLVVVVHDPVAFARWHLGELSWGEALRSGDRAPGVPDVGAGLADLAQGSRTRSATAPHQRAGPGRCRACVHVGLTSEPPVRRSGASQAAPGSDVALLAPRDAPHDRVTSMNGHKGA